MITRRVVYTLAVVALFIVAPLHGHQFWCDLLTVAVPAFVIGVGTGRLSEARKGQLMALKVKVRDWFDRNYRILYFVGLVAAVVGISLAAGASVTNARQDKEQTRLLACFDDYAADSAATSTKVRASTVLVDEKATSRDLALDKMFKYLATDPPEGDPRGTRLFLELLSANADLVLAQTDLDKVRKDNPVPKPPATFCAD